jgi:(p)ppGpp synthase/HD superfamily hydrolase
MHIQQINMEKENLIEIAKEYAIFCHTSTNHFYDIDKPYDVHLQLTFEYGLKFDYLLEENEWVYTLAACWCHDLIEDTRRTYNDVKNKTNKIVADIVYAVTNEKGKNRKERANDKYYTGIKNTPLATFVKCCDRLANIKYSVDNDSKMLDVYKKENNHFKAMLYIEQLKPMFEEMDKLLNNQK